jgi:acyl-coenzyme A synthetase/AMP-(fatty) acid ligase/thioesterase domain-containing protein
VREDPSRAVDPAIDPSAADAQQAGESLVARFDRAAAGHPDAPALIAGNEQFRYVDLQSWSAAIAAGVGDRFGPGVDPVATLIGHAPAAVAAMIGIARAGRPFVNLDPALPESRLRYMLDASGALALLVDARDAADRIPALAGLPVIAVPRAPAGASPLPAAPRPDRLAPACILFTSGSTGHPKGIVWPHATMTKDARAGREILGIAAGDRVGLVMPIEFVAGMVVANWALTSGATLCVIDPRHHPIGELAAWIERERITTLHATPTLLRALLQAIGHARRFPDLRLVTTCGEPITDADVRATRRHVSDHCAFVNWTGSSEVGVLALAIAGPNASLHPGPLPAGQPLDEITIELSPIDTGPDERSVSETGARAGELVIISDAIALGYCESQDDRPDRLTARGTVRRYRTGDLATVDASGELRLLGRCDDAMKINGYLVEPAEIEAALLDLDGVADAYVCGDRTAAEPRLLAYLVTTPGYVNSGTLLRRHLRSRLPTHMIPATIVELPELPRTPRGKVDPHALATAEGTTLRAPERHATTDLEIYIAEIWRNVLGIQTVGIDDDFFELGGDSLAVEEVLSELQKLGPDLTTAAFIDSPTVAGLAAAAEIGSTARLSSGLIEMRRADDVPTMVCFAGAGGIAVAFEPLVRSLDVGLRILAVQMHALEYRGIPDFSVSRAARRFLTAFRGLGSAHPQVIVGHSFGGSVAIEVARELGRIGVEVPVLALLDTPPPQYEYASNVAPHQRAVTRFISSGARLWKSLPGDRPLDRITSVPRMVTAGPIRYRGIRHYGGFFNRGLVMQRLHVPEPYAGDVVIYVSEASAVDTDFTRWRRTLTGSVEFVSIPGDHHTMLRDPNVHALSADLCHRIRTSLGMLTS